MPRFLIYHPGEDARVFELTGNKPVAIGRAKSSNLILDNSSISRLHAIVHSMPDGKWQVIDRGSANGVRVNGAAVKEALLKPNDEISVGEYRLRYVEDSSAREMVAYGTPQLPPRVTKALGPSAYSGRFMEVQPVGNITSSGFARPARSGDRLNAAEHENKLLALLHRANRTLGELTTLEDATRCTLDLTLELAGAERAFLMLLDKDSIGRGDFSKGDYGFEPALIRHRTAASAPTSAPQLTISRTIIRQVMQGGLPLLVTDPQADPRLAPSASIAAAKIQSAMCAPLGMKERRFGLLYVDNLSRCGMFAVDDLNVFTVIAAEAGLAIDRIRQKSYAAEQLQHSGVSE